MSSDACAPPHGILLLGISSNPWRSPFGSGDNTSSINDRDYSASVVSHVNRETVPLLMTGEGEQRIDAIRYFWGTIQLEEKLRSH